MSIIIFSQVITRISTLGKPPNKSHMTSEENEDLENRLCKLKNQVDEMNGSMLKIVDLSRSQKILKREIDDKMEKSMEQFQIYILHTLDEILTKGVINMQGNHENKENNNVEP